jgi:hypothetical protein
MTLDQQSAVITVGTEIPINSGSNATATGVITQSIARRSLGVILQVTPHITPDGRILMRVIPEVSSVADPAFPLGNGQTSTSLNIQHLETTVSAYDGDTIMLGGMITKSDERLENKVPWFGDLPGVGALFRFRLEERKKTELVIIMTPHIVRNREEAQALMAQESRRIDWRLPDVMRVHGSANVFQMFPPPPTDPNCVLNTQEQTRPFRIVPNAMPVLNQPQLPSPRALPPAPTTLPGAPSATTIPPVAPTGAVTPANTATAAQGPAPAMEAPAQARPPVRNGLLKNLFMPAPAKQTINELPVVEGAPAPRPSIPVREVTPAPMPALNSLDGIPVIVPGGIVPQGAPTPLPMRIEN